MKKIWLGILGCIILAIFLSTLFANFDWSSKLSTLYAVAGIMFSIGMSLIVTSTFSKIKNTDKRKKFKESFNRVRNSFILEFLLVSIFYMFFGEIDTERIFTIWKIKFSLSTFTALSLAYSILFFIVNFIELQSLNNDLDEELNKS